MKSLKTLKPNITKDERKWKDELKKCARYNTHAFLIHLHKKEYNISSNQIWFDISTIEIYCVILNIESFQVYTVFIFAKRKIQSKKIIQELLYTAGTIQ